MNNQELAEKLGNNKTELKKRLLYTRSVLAKWVRPYFENYEYDFTNKRLIGSNGYILQWQLRYKPELPESYDNQQTSIGNVYLKKDNYTW